MKLYGPNGDVLKRVQRTKKYPVGFHPAARQTQIEKPKPKPRPEPDTTTPSGKGMPY